MRVTIFDLKGVEDRIIDQIRNHYTALDSESTIELIKVNEADVKDCFGCWNCWVKTPGVCVHKDIMEKVNPSIVNSDVVVIMVDVAKDFLNGTSKSFIDRLIPLYHPYIKIHNGEMFHYRRYKKYPEICFYYDASFTSEENERVLKGYLGRTIYHFSTKGSRLVVGDGVTVEALEHKVALDDLASIRAKSDPKGKIVIYNCSPRGKASNSKVIIEEIMKGMISQGSKEDQIDVRYLNQTQNHEDWANDIINHSRHLFVIPLYVHSMPGLVMKFFERINEINEINDDVSFGYLIQSGFFESSQSHYLRAYLPRLTKSLGAIYGGTAIKGGMEGIKIRPRGSLASVFASFQELGRGFVRDGVIPQGAIDSLASPVKLSRMFKAVYKFGQIIGLANFYWNMQLKKNKAFSQRNATPYPISPQK